MNTTGRSAATWARRKWHLIHVLPVGDSRDHEATPDCWCAPVVARLEGTSIHHHRAADNRPEYGSKADALGGLRRWRLMSWTVPVPGREGER